MAAIVCTGSFNHTERFLRNAKKRDFYKNLDQYGRMGVEALSAATPVDTGTTAESWGYEIHESKGRVEIVWTNSNINDGWACVALLIQYGHGLPQGGYVEGIDYINPAMRPIFDKIADGVWKEVTK